MILQDCGSIRGTFVPSGVGFAPPIEMLVFVGR